MRSRRQLNGSRLRDRRMRSFVAHDLLVVDRQARPIVRGGGELVGPGPANGDVAGPADAERLRRPGVPAVGEHLHRRSRIDDGHHRIPGPVHVREVARVHPVGGGHQGPQHADQRERQRGRHEHGQCEAAGPRHRPTPHAMGQQQDQAKAAGRQRRHDHRRQRGIAGHRGVDEHCVQPEGPPESRDDQAELKDWHEQRWTSALIAPRRLRGTSSMTAVVSARSVGR